MARNDIPLRILTPTLETAHINHDGHVVLTYEVLRARDNRQWFDDDINHAFEATHIVTQGFLIQYVHGKDSLELQIIKAARAKIDPQVLAHTWVMKTDPSDMRGFIRASIHPNMTDTDDIPTLKFCEGMHWLKSHFYS